MVVRNEWYRLLPESRHEFFTEHCGFVKSASATASVVHVHGPVDSISLEASLKGCVQLRAIYEQNRVAGCAMEETLQASHQHQQAIGSDCRVRVSSAAQRSLFAHSAALALTL